jgi:hypothetical protein
MGLVIRSAASEVFIPMQLVIPFRGLSYRVRVCFPPRCGSCNVSLAIGRVLYSISKTVLVWFSPISSPLRCGKLRKPKAVIPVVQKSLAPTRENMTHRSR